MAVDDKTLKTSLKALGRTATGVRRALAERSITGRREDIKCCAVAEYLKTEFPAVGRAVADALLEWKRDR